MNGQPQPLQYDSAERPPPFWPSEHTVSVGTNVDNHPVLRSILTPNGAALRSFRTHAAVIARDDIAAASISSTRATPRTADTPLTTIGQQRPAQRGCGR